MFRVFKFELICLTSKIKFFLNCFMNDFLHGCKFPAYFRYKTDYKILYTVRPICYAHH